jgi:type II secretory pathway component PulJ
LMPSRWREAHLIEELRRQRERLRKAGRMQAAAELADIEERIEREADAREAAAARAHVLTHWDKNRNGRWDPEEIEAYMAELSRMRELLPRFGARKQWYIEDRGAIFGALRITELCGDDDLRDHLHDESLLVCFDGKSGWVALPDLLGRTPTFG